MCLVAWTSPYAGNTLVQVGSTHILTMLLGPRALTLLPSHLLFIYIYSWCFLFCVYSAPLGFASPLVQSGVTPGVSCSVRSCLLFATVSCDWNCFSCATVLILVRDETAVSDELPASRLLFFSLSFCPFFFKDLSKQGCNCYFVALLHLKRSIYKFDASIFYCCVPEQTRKKKRYIWALVFSCVFQRG